MAAEQVRSWRIILAYSAVNDKARAPCQHIHAVHSLGMLTCPVHGLCCIAVAVGMPKGVKRSRPTGLKHAQAKAQARTKALCGQLGLPPAVTADAVSTTEQLLAKLYERQHSCGLAGRIHNRDKVHLTRKPHQCASSKPL